MRLGPCMGHFSVSNVVILAVTIWALVFGVTCNGVHHDMRCSCDQGVILR
jgi:hypothetical protein